MTPEETYRCATQVYRDFEGFLLNPNVYRSGSVVSYGTRVKIYHPLIVTFDHVSRLEEQRQYSYQMCDYSIIQMHYSFDRETLVEAELAYYGATPIADDLCPWIRIDYAPSEATGVTHPPCHMHTMLGEEVRIPLGGVPGPSMFIDFIMRLFDRKRYEQAHLQGGGLEKSRRDKLVHAPRLLDCGSDDLTKLLMLAIPPHHRDTTTT